MDDRFHFVGSTSSPCGTNLFFRLPKSDTRAQSSDSQPTQAPDLSQTPAVTQPAAASSDDSSVVYLGHSRIATTFEVHQSQPHCRDTTEVTTAILENDINNTKTVLNNIVEESGDWLYS